MENPFDEENFADLSTVAGCEISEVVDAFRDIWRNERYSPELLPEKLHFVDALLEQIALKEEEASQLAKSHNFDGHFAPPLIRMEISRLRYMISNYLRCRLEKIEFFAVYLRNLPDSEASKLLSIPERNFLAGYVNRTEEYLNASVAAFLPVGVPITSEGSGWHRAPEKPKIDVFTVVKPKEDILVQLTEGAADETLSAGEQYLLRYHSVKDFVAISDDLSDDGKIRRVQALLM